MSTNTNVDEVAKRTARWHFEKKGEVLNRFGKGWKKYSESPGAQTENTKYINMESETIDTTSYQPKYSYEIDLMYGDPSIKTIYDIANQRKTYSDALVEVLTVDTYDKREDGSFGAKLETLAVAVSSFDGDKKMQITGDLNGQGDGIYGTYSGDTKGDGTGTFTPDEPDTPAVGE